MWWATPPLVTCINPFRAHSSLVSLLCHFANKEAVRSRAGWRCSSPLGYLACPSMTRVLQTTAVARPAWVAALFQQCPPSDSCPSQPAHLILFCLPRGTKSRGLFKYMARSLTLRPTTPWPKGPGQT